MMFKNNKRKEEKYLEANSKINKIEKNNLNKIDNTNNKKNKKLNKKQEEKYLKANSKINEIEKNNLNKIDNTNNKKHKKLNKRQEEKYLKANSKINEIVNHEEKEVNEFKKLNLKQQKKYLKANNKKIVFKKKEDTQTIFKNNLLKMEKSSKVFITILSVFTFFSISGTIALPIVFSYMNAEALNSANYNIVRYEKKEEMIILEDRIKKLNTFDSITKVINDVNLENNWDKYLTILNKNNQIVQNSIKNINSTFSYENNRVNLLLNIQYDEKYNISLNVDKILVVLQKRVIEDGISIVNNANAIFQQEISKANLQDNTTALINWLNDASRAAFLASLFSTNDINITNNFRSTVTSEVINGRNTYRVNLTFSISEFYIFNNPQNTSVAFGPFLI